MKRNFSPFWVCLVGMFLSCRPSFYPEEQTHDHLNIPSYPTDTTGPAFGLKDMQGRERHFNGWLVVWDPNATSSDMADVLTATVNFHRSYAKYLSYYATEVNPLRDKIKALEASKASLLQDANDKLRAERWQALRHWVEDRLSQPEMGLDEASLASALDNFSYFCDAKIWEFATTKENFQRSYQRRPTPAVICESYYSTQGYFSGEQANCAESQEPKDFFSCFWREGVLKTKLFARIHDATRVAALSDSAVENTILTKLVSQAILGQRRVVRLDEQNFDFSFVGSKVLSDTTARISDLTVASVLQAYALSRSTDIAADGCRIVSMLGSQRTDAFWQILESIRQDIRVMSGPLDDQLFNDLSTTSSAGTSSGIKDQCIQQGGSGICDILTTNDVDLDQQLSALNQQVQDTDGEMKQRSAAAEVACTDDQQNPSLQCQQQINSLRLSEAVTKPGVTVIVLPLQRFGIAVTPFEATNLSRVVFSLARPGEVSTEIAGCLKSDGESRDCPQESKNVGSALSTSFAAHDVWNLSWQIDHDPAKLGLSPLPFAGDRHNPELINLTSEQLARHRWDLSLNPRRWENVLDAFIGEVNLIADDASGLDYHGVTLMMDSDLTAVNARVIP